MIWSQYILGALETLQYEYNWYQAGDMLPEEASEAFRVIVQDAPYNLRSCPNPEGGRIFRVNSTGNVQELGDAGTWDDPSGDATIPPIPERTGGTPDDQICLAASNAANVLQQLYENITDSFNEGLDEAEATTALVLTIISVLGAEFAPITFALVTFFAIVFSTLYGILEFVGADLWNDAFTNQLVCILVGCATNDAGVVTFDWDCFNNALAAQTNIFSLTVEQLRLFGQIQYLLSVIGGVDALNTAGATTAITSADCSDCAPAGCLVTLTFEPDEPYTIMSFGHGTTFADATLDSGFGNPAPSLIDGKGYSGAEFGMGVAIEVDMGAPISLTDCSFDWWLQRNDANNMYVEIQWLDATHALLGSNVQTISGTLAAWHSFALTGIGASGVSFVRIYLAGSSLLFTTGDIWLDNVCINMS